ncbi:MULTISPECIES: hypothetical protein [Pantoea]|jgi:hypothetical protein|uniref:Uncharacterized protein n=1 Tax=Pantoea brenneri TaxID=472694 RepID=A0A7Y6NH02_9GAMM|nr:MULTISPECIES: hypothetical protein [Pantoea]MBZ6397061.1 hypothetical protein [Pantoea sp.]MBZ6440188.1 hypothetical protein [Pantoea sp.]NUY43450.1 hypothetical protein [Pantoea brenneri]NUY50984.1 hypothetical protein [Pantoea brenneri]NUY61285.1 hypothetical protein [Pantoea brenneri]
MSDMGIFNNGYGSMANYGATQNGGLDLSVFNTGQPAGAAGLGLGQAGGAADSGLFSMSSMFGGKDAGGAQSTGWVTGGLGALQGIGNLYLGMQSYGLAKQQFAAQQQAYKTNLANSVNSYNTALEDKIRGRTSDYAGKEQDVQNYLASHKATT